jgi:hypothetical protein
MLCLSNDATFTRAPHTLGFVLKNWSSFVGNDVDFVAGVVHVSRALNWKTKEIGLPRTEEAIRPVPIDAALFPALRERVGKPEEFVAPRFNDDQAAPTFRVDLQTAGVLSLRLSRRLRRTYRWTSARCETHTPHGTRSQGSTFRS